MSLLLKYYNSIDNNENLQFKDLVKKTVVLFMILVACRKQDLFTITVDNIVVEENKIVFLPNKTLKHRNTGKPLEPLIYHIYTANNKLYIVNCVNSYLGVREKIVDANVTEFIITYGKPHKPASWDTMSRWIKDELGKVGINTNVYTTHSCRAASTSKAMDNGVSPTKIQNRGCWKNENTFRTFYSKDIIDQNSREDFNFARPLLSSSEINL